MRRAVSACSVGDLAQHAVDQAEQPVLVAGVADEQVDVPGGAVGQRLPGGGRQDVAVDDRCERHRPVGDRAPAVLPPVDLRGDGLAARGQPGGVNGRQAGHRGPHPQFGGAGGGDVGGQLRREERPRHALRDGPAEEPGRPRHGQQRGDRSAARRLAEDRHPVRVAAEGPDVVPHPLQRGDLVEQAPVGRGAVDLRETLDRPDGS